jgi:predicted kinase
VRHTQLLILVSGAPGTGKSTLAPILARRYACTLLAKDAIKEALFDTLGTADAAWSRRLSDASFAALFALAAQGLAEGASLVIEGNFRRGEHEQPISAALGRAANSVRCAQVLCSLPEDLRRERLLSRSGSGARHAGHLDGANALAPSACEFLDISAARFDYRADGRDSPEKSSKAAEEALFAALDAHLQQS